MLDAYSARPRPTQSLRMRRPTMATGNPPEVSSTPRRRVASRYHHEAPYFGHIQSSVQIVEVPPAPQTRPRRFRYDFTNSHILLEFQFRPSKPASPRVSKHLSLRDYNLIRRIT
ncbi:hypothetical protein BDP81DRAFT_446676 [Colletotrichum phormii]|uniref:Uncharacterized protein n=1 Tax=Colletotrichum phormii TaxID=359342 RepID=A0AAI9ZY34_9PEZI|nr:uncharacterized protein BDP81DRAFT_446676 [Colletotrichum phormii]KAK1640347.1 hypothetical protein BDP81DRAFT_446676 [Colletotrichum phormii]